MLQLTPAQLMRLNALLSETQDRVLRITQNFRGPENCCDHILVSWDAGAASCRIDDDGNRFDNQRKELAT